ncbi:S-layer homology domain-containing protein [Paenibacillaceae bacterium GAS479]|nr:S-layer homology domain-containing protein [Paenibacillaceae bacterium GAS479]
MSRLARMTALTAVVLSLLLCLPVLPALADAAAPAIELKMKSQGKRIDITVSGKKLTDVFAYDISMKFDSARLKFTGARTAWAGFSIDPIVKDGTIRFAHTKTGKTAGESGDKELAVLSFERIAEGSATASIGTVQLVNSKLEMKELKPALQVTASGTAGELSDIKGHWAEAAIKEAAELGFINGYADGTFLPNREVTRAEFAAMIVRALQLQQEPSDALSFSDNGKIPQWAQPFIAAAAKANLLTGYDDGSFRAGQLINRAEMVAIIMRALPVQAAQDAKLNFADAKDIPAWAAGSVAAAVELGVIKGRDGNRFVADGRATRAEAVTVLIAMLKQR